MKLELDFAVEKPLLDYEFAIGSRFADASEMLDAGIKCAQEGSREEARRLLLRVAADEPENETAWLWLASVSDYPEELLVFLQNVLNVNPNSERALEWLKQTKSMLANTFVQRGVQAAQESRQQLAVQYFTQALAHDDRNEAAWLALAADAASPEEKAARLAKVLSINPNNETAAASLQSLNLEISQALLKKANSAAISGERGEARQFLAAALENAPELEEAWILKAYLANEAREKIDCYEKILSLNPENEAALAGLTSLQASMQKSADRKSNHATLYEASARDDGENQSNESLESSSDIREFQAERFSEKIHASEEMSEVDENSENENSEDESQNFAVEFRADENFSAEFPENPLGEIEANFTDEVKSRGDFRDAPGDFGSVADDENRVSDDDERIEDSDDFLLIDDADALESPEDFDFESISYLDETDETGDAPLLENAVCGVESKDEVLELPISGDLSETEENEFFAIEFSNVSDEENFAPAAKTAQPSENEPNEEVLTGEESSVSAEDAHGENVYAVESNAASENLSPNQELAAAQRRNFARNENFSPSADFYAAPDNAANSIHKSFLPQTEPFACPFCCAVNAPQSFACRACRAMLSLSDLEMLLSHTAARADVLEMWIAALESERAARPLTETELTHLAIAHLNAKNPRAGLNYLQQASRMTPNNIVLASKVNFLAIRLSEIEAQESRAEAATKLRNLTIMIVDHNPTVRRLVCSKLEKSGHTVVAASDGTEALSKIREVVPDLILLDIVLPQMDGYQVCKLIRGNEPTRDVPVVMLSGKEGFFDQARGLTAGTTGYITKPFGPETLMRTIETYVV